jgi:hypothetical protein
LATLGVTEPGESEEVDDEPDPSSADVVATPENSHAHPAIDADAEGVTTIDRLFAPPTIPAAYQMST